MKKKIIGLLTVLLIFIVQNAYSAGLGGQGSFLGSGGNIGGMSGPLDAAVLMSNVMAPSLQPNAIAPIYALGIGILPQINVLMDPMALSILPGGTNNIPLNPGIGLLGGQVPINGMNNVGILGSGMPGLEASAIGISMLGIPGAGNSIGLGAGPIMGISPGTGIGFGASPMMGLTPGNMLGLLPAPMMGLTPGLMINFGAAPVMGLAPGLMMGAAPGFMMNFSPGPMMGLGPGPMMNPGFNPMMGLSPGNMMGFAPGHMTTFGSMPVMGMPNNSFTPWNVSLPFNQSGPITNNLSPPYNNISINPDLDNSQPNPGRGQSGNKRVIFLGTSVEGSRPDGTPNIVWHYLDTYTGKQISGYSQGVDLPVPDYHWWYGCAPTSAGMMMGYFDIYGYNGITYDLIPGGIAELSSYYTGSPYPIDRPLDPPSPIGPTLLCNKAIASTGHLADFWAYINGTGDPLASGRTIPSQFDCLADFMGTSQDNLNSAGDDNPDGQTFFYFWTDGSRMTTIDLLNLGYDVYNHSGTYGMIEYTQYCGYRAFAFNQYVLGFQGKTLGFTFSDYVGEIDAGRPVILHLSGHMMLGIGYYLTTETVLVHDTWNNSSLTGPLTMPWGGTYQDPDGNILSHYAVTCFIPQ